ncbi:MAG: site-specific integrase [Candidatus Paceibacterota bacterium]|jgi:integrase
MKLTKSVIDKAVYKGGYDIRWDSSLPGFGLRTYPSGRKAFVLSYRLKGRKHLMTVGAYGALTLDQARDLARRKVGQIVEGSDPLEERRKAASGKLVSDLCRDYMERYALKFKKSWKEDARLIARYILPTWKNHQVAELKRSDVAFLHHKIGKTSHYEANRMLSLASKMFELARTEYGFLDDNSANPARGIKRHPEVKRDRWVTQDEFPALIGAINTEANLYIRSALWLYLLTGVRKSELLRAKWSDLDFQRKALKLPDTKSGRPHYVPLSPPALAIFQKLPHQAENPFIFVGHKKGSHLVGIFKNWDRVRKKARLEDVRLHDLRRTVGSWLAQSGHSIHQIGKVLNQSNLSTTANVYAHLAENQTRDALDMHGRAIETVLKKARSRRKVQLQLRVST